MIRISYIFLALIAFCAHPGSLEAQKVKPRKANTDTIPKRQDEINDFSKLPVDSMEIQYGNKRNRIRGYRRDGDYTLHVEGDILFDYETQGIRAVGTSRLWEKKKGRIIIPYSIGANLDAGRISAAFAMWTKGLPVDFVPKLSTTIDYIVFIRTENTQSYVGRNGGRQNIEIADWANPGNIAHEIGHALGLYHEMSRQDRDQNIVIHCQQDLNFQIAFDEDPYAVDLGPYDFFSIMHYSPSKCMEVRKSALPKEGLPKGVPGQRENVSPGDFNGLRQIYQLQ